MVDMNRGLIGPSATGGHVHRLEDLADVTGEPRNGYVLMFVDGMWRPVKLGPGPVPDLLPPTLLSAVPGSTVVSLEWKPDPLSATPLGYAVRYRKAGSQDWSTKDAGLVTSTLVTLLENGVAYEFAVQCYDQDRSSDLSNVLAATPVAPEPDALVPPVIDGADPGDGQATVSWSPPGSGGQYDAFQLEWSIAGSGDWTRVDVGLALQWTVTGLANGIEYSFRVRTSRRLPAAVSSPSGTVNATPQSAAPGAPVIVDVSPGDGLLSVAWQAPVTGATPTGYRVQRSVDGSSWVDVDVAVQLTATLDGLVNGTTYKVRVRALAGLVAGIASDVVEATPVAPEPEGLVVTGYDEVFDDDTHVLYLFTKDGQAKVTGRGEAQLLVVGAGGGSAGYSDPGGFFNAGWYYRPGGGGGGQVLFDVVSLSTGDYDVSVGKIGKLGTLTSPGALGGQSSLSGPGVDMTAAGGGGGGAPNSSPGTTGYSGGGGGARCYGSGGGSYSQGAVTQGGSGASPGTLTSPEGFAYPGAGGGVSGQPVFVSSLQAYQSARPGWLPGADAYPAWGRWVTSVTRSSDGTAWGLAMGGSTDSLTPSNFSVFAKTAYGYGMTEGGGYPQQAGGVVVVGVPKQP